jgi:hypothetical protein
VQAADILNEDNKYEDKDGARTYLTTKMNNGDIKAAILSRVF